MRALIRTTAARRTPLPGERSLYYPENPLNHLPFDAEPALPLERLFAPARDAEAFIGMNRAVESLRAGLPGCVRPGPNSGFYLWPAFERGDTVNKLKTWTLPEFTFRKDTIPEDQFRVRDDFFLFRRNLRRISVESAVLGI